MIDLPQPPGFVGAKVALICQGQIVTYLRDDKPRLPFATCWDLPGGAREGDETAEACLFREVTEEFGLHLTPAHLRWAGVFTSMLWPDRPALFYAGVLSEAEVAAIVFGDEGQCWRMMPLAEWLAHSQAVPEMQRRTALALADLPRA